MAHISIKKYEPTNQSQFDRQVTILVEQGMRRRWTKLAGPPRELSFELVAPRQVNTEPQPALKPSLWGSLPIEIVYLIFEMMNEPYHHQAVMTTTPFCTSPNELDKMRVGVHKSRDWCNIAMYHINQHTRKTAIRLYGDPCRWSFPFCRDFDNMTINLNEEGTFLVGRWALSTSLNDNISHFTIRTLEGEDLIVKDEALKPFGSPSIISITDVLKNVINKASVATADATDGASLVIFHSFWKGHALAGYLSQKNPAVLADLEVDGETTRVLSETFKPLSSVPHLKNFVALFGHEVSEDVLEE
jgi:hypothetical protein